MHSKVTVVCTSCGRFDLLEQTLSSFFKFNTYPIDKYVIVDNFPGSFEKILEICQNSLPKQHFQVISNKKNIGQVASLDIGYSNVETEYIFGLEDDWMFYKSEFIEKSLDVLKHDERIMNVNIRQRNNNEKGSCHPVSFVKRTTPSGVGYYDCLKHYYGVYHGFSWNPGLRRLKDYELIQGGFSSLKNEEGMNEFYLKHGFKAVFLEDDNCHHIGEGYESEGRNS